MTTTFLLGGGGGAIREQKTVHSELPLIKTPKMRPSLCIEATLVYIHQDTPVARLEVDISTVLAYLEPAVAAVSQHTQPTASSFLSSHLLLPLF